MKKILILIFGYSLFCGIAVSVAQEENVLPPSVPVNATVEASTPSLPTATFQLQYVSPQMVVDQVRELMGSVQGGVIVNEQKRQLEISAPSEKLEKIKSLILKLDKEQDISVDVKVVQVDLNDEHLPGINWSAIVSDYKSFTVNEDNRKFSVGTVSDEDLTVLLEALETVGETNEFPVKAVRINNGQDADLRLKAFDRDVSVSMTPVMAPETHVNEQQDRYTARLLISSSASNDNAVDFRITSTDGSMITVHVKNNTVAVIGGIFTQTKSQSTKKLPFLGDLPLFGVVFRDQSKVVHRLENIIFLTPHVSTSLTNATTK